MLDVETAPDVYQVSWVDAWGDTDQHSADYWKEEFPVQSVGFLVRDEETVLSLAAEILPDGEYRGVLHVPRQLVVSCRKLTKGVN